MRTLTEGLDLFKEEYKRNEILKVTKDELSSLIGITKNNLKTLERKGQLEDRLSKNGYQLVKKEKIGRRIIYKIKLTNQYKKRYDRVCKELFKTNKSNLFNIYFLERAKDNNIITKKELSVKAKVGVSTINKWDKIMLENALISENDYAYFKVEFGDNYEKYLTQISKEEYNAYWYIRLSSSAYRKVKEKFEEDNDVDKLIKNASEIAKAEMMITEYFCYRVKLYKPNKETQLFIDIDYLIRSIKAIE